MFNMKEPAVNKAICNFKEHPNKKEWDTERGADDDTENCGS